MFVVEKVRGFDGVCIVMHSEGFDKIMNCIDGILSISKEWKEINCITTGSERLREVLIERADFDIEDKNVYVQLDFDELTIFINIISIFCHTPFEDSQYNFLNCIERPNCKKF